MSDQELDQLCRDVDDEPRSGREVPVDKQYKDPEELDFN